MCVSLSLPYHLEKKERERIFSLDEFLELDIKNGLFPPYIYLYVYIPPLSLSLSLLKLLLLLIFLALSPTVIPHITQ